MLSMAEFCAKCAFGGTAADTCYAIHKNVRSRMSGSQGSDAGLGAEFDSLDEQPQHDVNEEVSQKPRMRLVMQDCVLKMMAQKMPTLCNRPRFISLLFRCLFIGPDIYATMF